MAAPAGQAYLLIPPRLVKLLPKHCLQIHSRQLSESQLLFGLISRVENAGPGNKVFCFLQRLEVQSAAQTHLQNTSGCLLVAKICSASWVRQVQLGTQVFSGWGNNRGA